MLKKFLSRTTRPISTKLGRKHAWDVQIKGLNKENFNKSSKIFL